MDFLPIVTISFFILILSLKKAWELWDCNLNLNFSLKTEFIKLIVFLKSLVLTENYPFTPLLPIKNEPLISKFIN